MAKKLERHGRRWFAFLLCRTVNTGCGLDVNRLLEETPLELFEEWRTLYSIEPWAEERTDVAIGVSIAENYAAHGIDSLKPVEYMPYLKKPKTKAQPEDIMKATWDAICKSRSKSECK